MLNFLANCLSIFCILIFSLFFCLSYTLEFCNSIRLILVNISKDLVLRLIKWPKKRRKSATSSSSYMMCVKRKLDVSSTGGITASPDVTIVFSLKMTASTVKIKG